MKCALLPYTDIDGIPTFTDSLIRGLFHRMEDEGLVGAVFSDGSVTTADKFLHLMKFGMNRLFVIDLEGCLAGCVWLNNFETRKADFHFCFFSNLRGDLAVEEGKGIVTELLNMTNESGAPVFDLLVGLVSTLNPAALRWCRRMEFSTLGTLPSAAYDAKSGGSVPGEVFYVERGEYGKGR